MRLLKSAFSFLLVLLLSACASLPLGSKGVSSVDPDALASAESQVASLQVELTRLKSENARLTTKLLEFQRTADAVTNVSDNGGDREVSEDTKTAALPEPPVIRLPEVVPPQNPVVDDPQAPTLRSAEVPVETAPRLVKPTFASTDSVFEDESAGRDIETSSVLFGVHLASYRKENEAREGWQKLQRDNPDQLGLLEPRIDRVTLPEKGIFLRLIGGGFSTNDRAHALCSQLKEKGLFCSVVSFGGERLAMADEG